MSMEHEDELSHGEKIRLGKMRAAERRASENTSEDEAMESVEHQDDNPRVYPTRVRMTRPHGWVDDDGVAHMFPQGFVTDDAEQIKLLVDRDSKNYVVVE